MDTLATTNILLIVVAILLFLILVFHPWRPFR